MRRSRKTKLITMIALVIAIVGMTLGFAAFSSTLTISSSATVTPNDAQFNLKIYGYTEETDESSAFISYYNSETSSNFFSSNDYGTKNPIGTVATIDNNNLSIKDINAVFSEPGQLISYYFAVKNEGSYDAYINLDDLSQTITKTCTAASGTSNDLVQSACEYIDLDIMIANTSVETGFQCYKELEKLMEEIDGDGTRTEEEEIAIQEKAQECDSIKYVYTKDDTGSYKIVKGSYILLGVSVYYISSESQPLADGEFSIQFSDLKFNFTTNNPHPTE